MIKIVGVEKRESKVDCSSFDFPASYKTPFVVLATTVLCLKRCIEVDSMSIDYFVNSGGLSFFPHSQNHSVSDLIKTCSTVASNV